MKRLAAVAAIAAMATFGGTVAADDYPPAGGATTVPMKPGGGGGGQLPATGTDSTSTMQIAGGVLIAGLGLSAVAWRRRRSTAAAV